MKKVLVFGATGHLGAYTVDYLKESFNQNKFELIAIGRKQTDFFEKQGIKYCQVDVTDKDAFKRLPQEDVFAVVCFVGMMPAAMQGYNPHIYVDVNVTGVLNILEYCRINQVDRILFTQTEADLSGYWEKNAVIKPDLPRKFSYKGSYSLYIITKNAAVDLIESYYQNHGLKRFIFRLPTVYHYRPDPYYYKDGVKKKLGYRQLMEYAMEGKQIEMWGDPSLAKDIVYVKDFTQMVYKAILTDVEGGIYNVGTGKTVTLEDQIKGIIEVFSPKGRRSEIIPRPDKPNSRSFVMDIENAKEDLGYRPQYSYIDYLKDFKKEMKLNRFADLWDK
ncbi:NAD(P)-dependent oxidoreductase [Bacilli bacterium]|nr:NDP-sugar epimerase [Bacilli bacterium VT-13-104]PZD84346.1 NAD(P)-dependent oxidoreductase [Bacilli bacterium]PZD86039.1 NAD(P)-dependent oxidoreductase [Bacilli bacterium]PZD89261.1 NAD(P)-dependent oxidoreductase [Bacilli bacterium]RCO05218.1 NAD(P)-dependent oxidoreductase [Bacilli bacterium]